MDIRLAYIDKESITDGTGMRLVVYAQGCPHNCEDCHNPDTHAFDGGQIRDTSVVIQHLIENPLLDGVTLSGGDPMCQTKAFCALVNGVKEKFPDMTIWCYTGYTIEQCLMDESRLELTKLLDVMVDGKYEPSKRSLSVPFKGSENQRIIDVKKTLLCGEVCLFDMERQG